MKGSDWLVRARTVAGVILASAAVVAIACHDSTAPPSAPTSMRFVAGSGQAAPAGTEIAVHPVVQIVDQYEQPVSGQVVTFKVEGGGGSISSTPVTTDADGKATAPSWILGKSDVAQSISATSGALTSLIFASVQTEYDLDVRFFGPAMSPVVADAFTSAAARIRGAVTGDVANYSPPNPIDLTQCNVSGTPQLNEVVDDAIVYAAVIPIDGFGKILASAGPCLIRSGFKNRQTIIGVMRFDVADVDTMIAQGTLQDVIQHEMLHVVGFGTVWNAYSVLAGAGTSESRFVGALGVSACVTLGGGPICPGSVPVENTGGPGTADGHWRESVFKTEMMTGFVTHPTPGFSGILNPFSLMSIQSIGDIGYVVNPAAADPFTVPSLSVLGGLAQVNVGSGGQASWEEVVRPRFELSPSGSVSVITNR